jgi:hypothetical protein
LPKKEVLVQACTSLSRLKKLEKVKSVKVTSAVFSHKVDFRLFIESQKAKKRFKKLSKAVKIIKLGKLFYSHQ